MSVAPSRLVMPVLPSLRRQSRSGRDFRMIDAHYFIRMGSQAVLSDGLSAAGRRHRRGSDLKSSRQHAIPRGGSVGGKPADGLVACRTHEAALVEIGIGAERVQVMRTEVISLFSTMGPQRGAAMPRLDGGDPSRPFGNLVALKRHHLRIEALTTAMASSS